MFLAICMAWRCLRHQALEPWKPDRWERSSTSCRPRRRWPSSTRRRSTDAGWRPTRPRWPACRPSTSRCPTSGADPLATLAAARRRRGPGDRRDDRSPLLRLRHRRHVPGRPRERVAGERVGPERGAPGDVAGGGEAPRRRQPAGSSTCSGCPPAPASPSSPARPWPTPRASPPPGTRCSIGLGWDVQADGLFGAPPLAGRRRRAGPLHAVEVARPRRPRPRPRRRSFPPTTRAGCGPSCCPTSTGPVLVCAQAGEVNTGAFDPFDEIADWLARAVGLAARRRRLRPVGPGRSEPSRPRRAGSTGPTRGPPTGTSGSTSPTTAASPSSAGSATSGARSPRPPATCRPTSGFEAMHHTPQSSQRARARSRSGRCCGRSAGRASPTWSPAPATRRCSIAERLRAGGLTILNDVVLNQVLVRLRRRADDRGADRRDPGRRPHLVRPDPVGRGDGDADQRVVVEDRCSTTPPSPPT